MIDDLRALQDGTILECDLCIIGAGAAGIALAREFIGRSYSVLLLESGGLEFEAETQRLYDFENVGLSRSSETRMRYFGGTTNVWEGRCALLSDADFRPRPWVADSGWPLSSADLEPYYGAAHTVCHLALNTYRQKVGPLLGGWTPAFDRSKLKNQFWQFGPASTTRFGVDYRGDLAKSANVRVLLHANATNLQLSPNAAAVEHVDIRTLDGLTARVRARFVVLACGGIENARLLLLSNGVEPHGLGNRHDLVGRYFMEHPRSVCADIVARDDYQFETTYSGYWHPSGAHFLMGVALSPAAQARDELMSCAAIFEYDEASNSGTRALQRLLHRGGAEDADTTADAMLRDVWRVMTDLDEVVVNGRRKVLLPGKDVYIRPQRITMTCDVEQAPNPDSRVTLSRERDALGLNKARLDWRISERERRTVAAFARAVGEEFGRLNIARVRLADELTDPSLPGQWEEAHHHMGTTRMASMPQNGVVSRDCQVFGTSNLYVAGSSVFPTTGFVNPTLTIIALALRLADHLRSRL